MASKRDYVAVSKVIRDATEQHPLDRVGIAAVAVGLAALYAADNPRFNTTMFLQECAPVSWAVADAEDGV